MTKEQYVKNLSVPTGKVDVVLDTDAFNEIDDQFAIAYLLRWQENGLLTAEQIRSGDRKPVPQGATGQLGDAEREAIANLLREG